MKNKDKKLFSKVLILVLLVLVIIGFTLPAALDRNQEQAYVEPRICQTDSDCYLICEDKPVMVLCSQNLCVQNSCTEANYYNYTSTPLSFELSVFNQTGIVDLEAKTSSKNMFVKFSGKTVQLYSNGMSLGQVLEKVGLKVNPALGNVSVNNEPDYAYSDYVVKAGDKVEIVYS